MLTYFPGLTSTGKAALCLAALAFFPLTAQAAEKAGGSTLENLVAAFNGESNANARYVAFAVKADQEGYKGVGSLFRAAARAEEIHAEDLPTLVAHFLRRLAEDLKVPQRPISAEALDRLRSILENVERELIIGALSSAGGAQAEAARRLGISRSDLAYKVNKYNLRPHLS